MRNVRNFWIEVDVDGRKEKVATGPRNKEGGFEITIGMRTKKGDVSNNEIKIKGYVKEIRKDERDLIVWIEDRKQMKHAVTIENDND